jgi:hypothetical protein
MGKKLGTNSEEIKGLLIELGLFYQDSEFSVENRVRELNMRQLDRLKMMFGRIDAAHTIFSDKERNGIRNNDLAEFAEAVQTLNALLK